MQGKSKDEMKNFFVIELEKHFDLIFNDTNKNNPLANSPMGGMLPYNRILEASKIFKKDSIDMKDAIQMTEVEIIETVDIVTNKVLKKYFDNFS